MTINDLIDGMYYDFQGPVEVRQLKNNGADLETLFSCENGFDDLPEDVSEMKIVFMYGEPCGKGVAAIIIEVEDE